MCAHTVPWFWPRWNSGNRNLSWYNPFCRAEGRDQRTDRPRYCVCSDRPPKSWAVPNIFFRIRFVFELWAKQCILIRPNSANAILVQPYQKYIFQFFCQIACIRFVWITTLYSYTTLWFIVNRDNCFKLSLVSGIDISHVLYGTS